jgi:hypothetical protein
LAPKSPFRKTGQSADCPRNLFAGRSGDPPENRTARAANPGGGNTSAEWAGEPKRQNRRSRQQRQARDDVEIDIYDSRCRIGHIVEHEAGRRCDAYGSAGEPLGVFPTSVKAARAVYAAAVDQCEAAA